ncbi:MAG: hypothetical protein JKY01_00455 [Pseudomonadales bacterium]|nr:hypothetical protein [Pseudomonadales bacterium]
MNNHFNAVVTDLPYTIPSGVREQINQLSRIVGIPPYLMQGLDGVNILCGVIVYRHLDRLQKYQVMQLIHATKNPQVIGALSVKVTDVIVNPNWGLWSLTNKELAAKKKFHSAIDTYMTMLGLGASAGSISSLVKSSWSNKKVFNKNILLIIVWGGIWYSKQVLGETQDEIDSRKVFVKTPYH